MSGLSLPPGLGSFACVDVPHALQAIKLFPISNVLGEMRLPQHVVFLDVNGTLLERGHTPGDLPDALVSELNEIVKTLAASGVVVGLNSDTPLHQLREIARRLGIEGPLVAENGNIIFYAGVKRVLAKIENLQELEAAIEAHIAARDESHPQRRRVSRQLFGLDPDYARGEWAFGARESSVAVFADNSLLYALADWFSRTREADPEAWLGIRHKHHEALNLLVFHPQEDISGKKCETLADLSLLGKTVFMIGDSAADLFLDSAGVCRSAFVGSAHPDLRQRGVLQTSAPMLSGVIDLLRQYETLVHAR